MGGKIADVVMKEAVRVRASGNMNHEPQAQAGNGKMVGCVVTWGVWRDARTPGRFTDRVVVACIALL